MELSFSKGDLDTLTLALRQYGGFLLNHGYWNVVKYYVTELAEIHKNRGEIGLQASTMLNLGILCYNRGKLEDAIEAYKTTAFD